MDNSINGVIYVNFGSILKIGYLDDSFREALISTFSSMDMNIVMKSEVDLPNKTDNIYIRKWLPQKNILGM